MTKRNKLTIKFAVEEAGWAKFSIEFGNSMVEMDTSDVMNDPLSEMVEAALKLVQCQSGADFFVWEEPAECRWYLNSQNDNVEIKIVRYNELMSIPPSQEGTSIFSAEIDMVDFIRAVIRCIDDVIMSEGEEGYSRKWVDHKLPYSNLEILKSEFKEFKDNRKMRAKNRTTTAGIPRPF